ncbi:carboxypeptidase-like regulatory domain-containing protein [Paenibacillus flagellatus]|nr:carboxypeptidase-like regulatory domain-containing protein [Paenibacillus flagellatus]
MSPTHTDNRNPVAGAVVQVLDANHTPIATAVSDGVGFYRIVGLPRGAAVTVTVSAPTFGSAGIVRRLDAAGQSVVETFRLDPAPGALTGTVRDQRRNPLFNVMVRVLDPSRTMLRMVITNRRGRYDVADLAPGTYVVRFSLEGKQPLAREIVIESGKLTVLDVILLDEEEE